MSVAAVETAAVIGVKRQPEPDAPGQIWIRDKMTSERHQVSVAFGNDFFGAFGVEPSGRHDRSLEELTQINGRNRRQAVSFFLTANNARLDDV